MSVRPEVVDLAACSIQHEMCPREVKQQLGLRLVQALERDACVYLINTALPEDKVGGIGPPPRAFFLSGSKHFFVKFHMMHSSVYYIIISSSNCNYFK